MTDIFPVYVDIGRKDIGRNSTVGFDATIDVRFGLFPGNRIFSLLVSQLSCKSEMKPNDGCLQYFTGITGTVHKLKPVENHWQ